jgi:hypothetical protein
VANHGGYLSRQQFAGNAMFAKKAKSFFISDVRNNPIARSNYEAEIGIS